MPSPAGLVALALSCFLVLVVGPDGVHGSSRRSFGRKNGAAAPVSSGICATLVTIHGYKCQEHEVKTEDGCILNMQRIPEGRVGGGHKKQPVLIQHGVLVDGMTWLMNSPEQNLPMILADIGFDVWIANTRGTRFCRSHVSLDPHYPVLFFLSPSSTCFDVDIHLRNSYRFGIVLGGTSGR
ncbi:Triacylglycerol lipase 2 [Hibiscus syriacus]|uniref:Triacylglycerol lipase 2 n=1 Tax=Hibiscus syriacus TaxID=106335 RepID=A0A6A3AQ15_HIBSY|nr:Triacylglycerol lipase 2 [Hibiscus syriacus]